MGNHIIHLLRRSDFDFTALTDGTTVANIPIGIPNVSLRRWATGTLLVRIHAGTANGSASTLRFDLKATAPSDEEPGKFFRGPIIATVNVPIGLAPNPPWAPPFVLRGNYGGRGGDAASLFLTVYCAKVGTYTFTVSVDLVVQEAADSWSPLQLPSCKLLLDEHELAQTTTGKYPLWGDQSPTNSDFTQGVGAQQPILFTFPPTNQWPAPSFISASSTYLTGPTLGTIVQAGAYHIFVVFAARTAAGIDPNPYMNTGVFGDSAAWWGLYLKADLSIRGYHWDGSAKEAVVTTGFALNTLCVVEWSFDGSTIRTRLNDGTVSTVAAGSIGDVSNTQRLGNGYVGGLFLDGRVATVIAFNTRLLDVDSKRVRDYLSSKYGVPV